MGRCIFLVPTLILESNSAVTTSAFIAKWFIPDLSGTPNNVEESDQPPHEPLVLIFGDRYIARK